MSEVNDMLTVFFIGQHCRLLYHLCSIRRPISRQEPTSCSRLGPWGHAASLRTWKFFRNVSPWAPYSRTRYGSVCRRCDAWLVGAWSGLWWRLTACGAARGQHCRSVLVDCISSPRHYSSVAEDLRTATRRTGAMRLSRCLCDVSRPPTVDSRCTLFARCWRTQCVADRSIDLPVVHFVSAVATRPASTANSTLGSWWHTLRARPQTLILIQP